MNNDIHRDVTSYVRHSLCDTKYLALDKARVRKCRNQELEFRCDVADVNRLGTETSLLIYVSTVSWLVEHFNLFSCQVKIVYKYCVLNKAGNKQKISPAILCKLVSSIVADISNMGHLNLALKKLQVSWLYGLIWAQPVSGSITYGKTKQMVRFIQSHRCMNSIPEPHLEPHTGGLCSSILAELLSHLSAQWRRR